MTPTLEMAQQCVAASECRSKVQSLQAIGLDHRTAPLAVRERVALDPDKRQELIARLHEQCGCEEAFVLSTCLRTEVITLGGRDIEQALAAVTGVSESFLREALLTWSGPREVASRLFHIAAGMESLALGETQIIGQVKAAYQQASDIGATGPVLNQLVERGLAVGREVRSKTAVGRGVVSIPSLAAHKARNILGSLAGKRVVIIGTGKMGHLSARHFGDAGAELIILSRREIRRAQALVDKYGGQAGLFTPDLSVCVGADIVICGTDITEPLITEANVGTLITDRDTPTLVIDLCVPHAIEPSVDTIDGVRLINLDSMRSKCEAARRRREEARAEAIPMIARAVEDFHAWWTGRQVKPTIRALQTHLDQIRLAEIDRLAKREGVDRDTLDALSRSLMGKIAHGAIACLRRGAAKGEGDRTVALVREVFRLNGDS